MSNSFMDRGNLHAFSKEGLRRRVRELENLVEEERVLFVRREQARTKAHAEETARLVEEARQWQEQFAKAKARVLYLAVTVLLTKRHRFVSWLGRLFRQEEPSRLFLAIAAKDLAYMQASERAAAEKAMMQTEKKILLAKEGVKAVETHAQEPGDGGEVVNIRAPRPVQDPGYVSAGDTGAASDIAPGGGGDLSRFREEG